MLAWVRKPVLTIVLSCNSPILPHNQHNIISQTHSSMLSNQIMQYHQTITKNTDLEKTLTSLTWKGLIEAIDSTTVSTAAPRMI